MASHYRRAAALGDTVDKLRALVATSQKATPPPPPAVGKVFDEEAIPVTYFLANVNADSVIGRELTRAARTGHT